MTLEKWFEKINEVVREFVKSIDEEYDSRMGADFVACLDENVIEWSVVFVEKAGEAFYKNFISRFPKADGFGLFTLSVLHEIGHLETEWEMEDETEIRNTKKMTNEEYFELFNEMIATDWAGYWIEDNFNEALALDKKFQAILDKFYADVLD